VDRQLFVPFILCADVASSFRRLQHGGTVSPHKLSGLNCPTSISLSLEAVLCLIFKLHEHVARRDIHNMFTKLSLRYHKGRETICENYTIIEVDVTEQTERAA
jgi:hypothetical protein